jgi:Spy/CpxP family protein refolding chaperone
MKRFTTLKMAAALVFAFAMFGTVAMAQAPVEGSGAQTGTSGGPSGGWGHGGHHRGFGDMDSRLYSKLNLTAEQKAAMKTIHEKYGAMFKETMTQMKAIRTQLNPSGAFDQETETKINEQSAPLMAQMKANHIAMQTELTNVLTADQKTQLAALKAQMHAEMQERRAAWQAAHPQGATQQQ